MFYLLTIAFAPDNSELNAGDTLSRLVYFSSRMISHWRYHTARSLAGLEHGVRLHDASRLKLHDEVNGAARKVSVQTRRLLAHHQTIQCIHGQSNALQDEVLKATEACVEQVLAIGNLQGEIFETEHRLVRRPTVNQHLLSSNAC